VYRGVSDRSDKNEIARGVMDRDTKTVEKGIRLR